MRNIAQTVPQFGAPYLRVQTLPRISKSVITIKDVEIKITKGAGL
ncbi:hypothetical protein [Bacillus sp. CHD6a]|nr:hypothetical protein [Bacillus sp. CHD6a]